MASITVTGGHRSVHLGDDDNSVYSDLRAHIRGGDGDNTLDLLRGGHVSLGDGDNAITMMGAGKLNLGSGNDTITLGVGHYRIHEDGTANVTLPYGEATVIGGSAVFDTDRSGTSATLMSGDGVLKADGPGAAQLAGGSGDVTMIGGAGPTTFIGGSGQDTMVGGGGAELFRFDSNSVGGDHLIQNFTSGQDHLYVERLSFSDLQSQGAISESGGNTYITLDGGHTTIELQGVTGLTAADIVRH